MTLPRIYALFDHWAENPPTYIGIKIAYGLKKPEEADSESNAQAFQMAPGVATHGNWRGGPPVTPQQVREMAEKAKHGG
jgi:hypothetical protein